MHTTKLVLIQTLAVLAIAAGTVSAQYAGWQHVGSLYILTTAEGANLPDTAREENFPLLIRLHKDWFDFSQAKANGADIRFVTATGQPLSYQIESWDAAAGSASIWVRIPEIKGNSRQEIRMHWGNAEAASASAGNAVFNASNGFLSVWHLGDQVKDEVGTLDSNDLGTTATAGMIGKARHFPGGKGVFCGDKILAYPSGDSVHSTQAWFRPDSSSGRVLGWGNEKAQGKVIMQYRSPPQVLMECYFSDANVRGEITTAMPQWVHTVHTYRQGQSLVYVNGVHVGTGNPRATPLSVERPARMWIGGWYNNYDFVGDIDEVRVSSVIRSADWIRLEYENQQPLQTLVGPLVQPGSEFSVSDREITLSEGSSVKLSAQAGGAQKVYWILKQGQHASIVAVDRFNFQFDAGRVSGDQLLSLQFQAVFNNDVKTLEIPVTVKEQIPEPIFTLKAPDDWDGREMIEVVPQISNLNEMQLNGAGELKYRWTISGLAVIKEIASGKLILHRAQNSGPLTITASINNGGDEISSATTILVTEPQADAWVERAPTKDEKPVDNQFYARNDQNEGSLHYNGTLGQDADSVFLKVYADDKLFAAESRQLAADNSYAFTVKLKPGLIRYRVEFGSRANGVETTLHTAGNLVCGDAYIIEGQSNALATDTREQAPAETNDWIRSYGKPANVSPDATLNLWSNPVWKAHSGEQTELGFWGMELAKRLVESQQVPICIINGAVGGTRIDQHQRNDRDPTDLSTIYGRLLWRVRQAKLTHGIRAVLWHQGENDQGAAGPDGGYGWETYQRYFVEMSAAWKQDFPNLRHYYIFQIWPNACSMGNGNGDMLREVQRTLPRLYSNMDIMSTLGISPPGGCHYPLTGWAEFARLIQPLIERDFYGKAVTRAITPPNLKQAYYTSDAKNAVALEFDQEVIWKASLASQFYLDAKGQVATASVSGNVLTLQLKEESTANRITYLKETSWDQDNLLIGKNGIAALTFCNVPLRLAVDRE